MTAEPVLAEETVSDLRQRRCIVTHAVLSEERLVRFVLDPAGHVIPDVAAKLPGRGMWVLADRETLERAVTKGHFSRAAKATAAVSSDLIGRVEKSLVARMCGDLGLARRSGQLFLGFDNVARALARAHPLTVLIEASDAANDGRRKLLAIRRGTPPVVVDYLTRAELSLALGRENVVHAALISGRLSQRLAADAGRLSGFRCKPGAQQDAH